MQKNGRQKSHAWKSLSSSKKNVNSCMPQKTHVRSILLGNSEKALSAIFKLISVGNHLFFWVPFSYISDGVEAYWPLITPSTPAPQ